MVQTVWAIRSLPEKNLNENPPPQELSPLFLALLSHRGIALTQSIEEFLQPSRKDLCNPFLMKGMTEAVARIQKAKTLREKVLVHGDYDVDGVTGAAIVSLALEKLRLSYETFLPERARDGYGVSGEALQRAARDGARLLITVDCGISAHEEIHEARKAGLETIVLDHHQIPASGLPPAHAILNPLQEGCSYPFKELSAGGLAFKLAQALLGPEAFEFFDLATLSTVADLAPLRGENRILVKEGLRQLSERKRIGIKAMSQEARVRAREIKTSHVGFVFGPRINASGRMSSPLTALRLLLTPSLREAESLAQILEQENRQRQQVERRVLEEALKEVERTVNFARDRVLVVAKEEWHAGVIGIVASRLVERYHRPALVIALKEKKGKGSGRSIRSVHLFEALEAAREFLLEFGGHEQAVGFSVEQDQILSLRKRLNDHCHASYAPETFLKSVDIDLEIRLSDLTPQFLRELEQLEPYGVGNPKPVFLTRGLQVKQVQPSKKGKTSRPQVWVTDGSLTYEVSVSERSGLRFDLEPGTPLDLVYTIDPRRWEGEAMTVLEAKDIKPSPAF